MVKVLPRLGIIILLSLVSIVIHESGHYIVYKLAGVPVHITLQSVHAAGEVNPGLDHLAKAMGPAFSLLAGVLLLVVARKRPTFFWVTAGLTNASLRLFPCVIDLVRALTQGHPFSDEGEVVLAWTNSTVGRSFLVSLLILIYAVVSIAVARHYSFEKWRGAKAIGVYLLSLATGIGVIIVDQLLNGMSM